MVCVEGKKRKAIVNIVNENQNPGTPSEHYINTIRQGYIDNDMDLDILEKSLEWNFTKCGRRPLTQKRRSHILRTSFCVKRVAALLV